MMRAYLSALLFTFWTVFAIAEQPAAPKVKIAMYVGAGVAGKGPEMLLKTFGDSKEFELERLTLAELLADKLKGYSALIVPGGSSTKIGTTMKEEGRKIVRDFVDSGGTYVGICAGCYLSTCHYSWSLHILPAKIVEPETKHRGRALLQLEPTAQGKQWLLRDSLEPKTIYHNGPVLAPLADAKLIPLANFREEINRKANTKGLMVNTAAIAAAPFGKGWAVGISPHPEQTEGLTDVVPSVIRWTLGHRNTP